MIDVSNKKGVRSEVLFLLIMVALVLNGLPVFAEGVIQLASYSPESAVGNVTIGESTEKLQKEIETLKIDRDSLVNAVSKTRGENRQYAQEIEKLNAQLTDLEKKLAESPKQYATGEIEIPTANTITAVKNAGDVVDREEKTLDLLYKIDAYAEKDEALSIDAAKAHYNMGNIYYERGEYEIAAREYYQAITLMADDADAHYNLAYVSGDHLKDFRTALKHYKMYLYLSPNAKDKPFVEKKILEAEMQLRGVVDSPLEKSRE